MSSPTFTQVVSKLATLPEDAQNQVLTFIESLEQDTSRNEPTAKQARELDKLRYPLRGEEYRYDEPFEPAVPPEEWNAIGDQT